MNFTEEEKSVIIDALEERYNFCKSNISEDERFMCSGRCNEDTESMLDEMVLISKIWMKLR